MKHRIYVGGCAGRPFV